MAKNWVCPMLRMMEPAPPPAAAAATKETVDAATAALVMRMTLAVSGTSTCKNLQVCMST